MGKSQQYVILLLFILSICYGITMAEDALCDGWEPYEDEKCFKVFDKVVNEMEAEKICSQQDNGSTLITIHSKDEQEFLTNFLFKTNKIVDAVWIAVKYNSNSAKFKWIDGSDLSYSNWAGGRPQNLTGYDCVQMNADAASMGKWINEPCNKKNLVVCQKMQIWSLSRMQTSVLNTRKELEKLKNFNDYLFNNKWAHFKTFIDHNNNRKALIYPKVNGIRFTLKEAIKICQNNSASLVEIESHEKQSIVETFVYQSYPNNYFWIGGYKGSDGKFRWMSNGNQFSYTNWYSNEPQSNDDSVAISSALQTYDGQWFGLLNTSSCNVICEISFNF